MAAPDHIALQSAVHATLCAHTPLLALLPNGSQGIGVFARTGNNLPYVMIEAISSQPLRTQGDGLDDCEVVCAAYGEQPEMTQLRGVLHEIATALTQPMTVDGHRVVLQQCGGAQVSITGDGRIYRAACTLRVILEKVEA